MKKILTVNKGERIQRDGLKKNKIKTVLMSGASMTKNQALDILGKLIQDLRAYADPRVNVHRPIINQAETVEKVFKELEKLETLGQEK